MEQSRQQAVLRDLGALESAIAQPRQTFSGTDLYPGLAAKAAALAFSLIQNHAAAYRLSKSIGLT
jgi:death-on-curing protein